MSTYPKLRTIRIIRNRNVNLDVIRRTSPLELSSDFDHILHSTSSVTFYTSFDPY